MSVAPRVVFCAAKATPPIFLAISPVPLAASATLRAISLVVTVCSSTAEAMLLEMSLISLMACTAPLGRAICPHGDFQPVGCAGEGAGAEVNQHGEQAVGDQNGAVGDRPRDGNTAGVGGKEREGQVVSAAGWVAAGIKPALVGESRALGNGGGGWSVEDCEHRHDGETQRGEPMVFVFHKFVTAAVFVLFNQIISEQINAATRRTQRDAEKN